MRSAFRYTLAVGVIAALTFAPSLGASAAPQGVWSPASSVGSSNDDPIIASDGAAIVTAWVEGSGGSAVIRFQVTTDAGTTWSAINSLTSVNEMPDDVSVAVHGATIGVSYFSAWDNEIRARISTDSGLSWSAPTTVSTTGGNPQIAVADGVATIAFLAGNIALASVTADAGATWSAPVAVTPAPASGFPVTGVGVVRSQNSSTITWHDTPVWDNVLRASSSADGINWTPGQLLQPENTRNSETLQLGASIAVVTRYIDPTSYERSVRVLRSADGGVSWTTPAVLDTMDGLDELQSTRNGSRAAVSYVGRNASGDDELRMVSTADGGATWSAPRLVVDGLGEDISSYTTFALDDALIAAYNIEVSGVLTLRTVISFDGGATWGAPTDFPSGGDGVQPFLAGWQDNAVLTFVSPSGQLTRAAVVVVPDAAGNGTGTGNGGGTGTDQAADVAGGDAARLPDTGADVAPFLMIGGVVVVLGVALLVIARVRRRSRV